MADKSTSVEDIEALEIERERQREILENYKTVDRIVDQRIAPATIDVNHEHSMSQYVLLLGALIRLGQSNTFASGKG